MNRDLVERESSYSDQWDDRGHYTKDEGTYVCAWSMALNTMDAITASVECLCVELESGDKDSFTLAGGLFFTALFDYASTVGVDIDDVFDDTNEVDEYILAMIDIAIDAIDKDWNAAKIHEVLVDRLPGFFGE